AFLEKDETVLPARNRALHYGFRKSRCYIHKRYSTIHVFLKYGRAIPFAFPSRWFQSFSLPYRLRLSCHMLCLAFLSLQRYKYSTSEVVRAIQYIKFAE